MGNYRGSQKGRHATIKATPIKYYGYLQGYKVEVNGKKYPKAKGEWYTALDEQQAIKNAMKDAKL